MLSSAALLRIIRECTLATHEFPAWSKQQGCALLPPSLLLDVRDCFSVPVQACADTGQFPASCQALVCVNASLHSRQAVRYGVCLRVAQACSSPKVQRCLADVAEQTECQCKLATDILLPASAVGTPVQACTDVAYALNLHLRTKTSQKRQVSTVSCCSGLCKRAETFVAAGKKLSKQNLRERAEVSVPAYLWLLSAAAPAPGPFHTVNLSVARLRWQDSPVKKVNLAPETSVAGRIRAERLDTMGAPVSVECASWGS
jgi:hypothetical protein